MSRSAFPLFSLLVIAALALAGCTTPSTAAPTSAPVVAGTSEEPQGAAETVIIGFTASQTGSQNVPSTGQLKGLQLWMNQVNDSGGLRLGNGTVLTFEAVSYDDESSKERVQELYTKLATEDEADFLISPYSSGLTDAAAVIAEQYGKIMITTGAASDSTYQNGYTLVFQTYTPASRYLTGAADLLASLDNSARRIAIVHENDKFSTDVANALNEYALAQGYEVVLNEGYDSGATDFAPFINKIEAAQPDAIMGGGHFADTSTFARQLYDEGIEAKFVSLLVAPPEPKFAELGEAALGIVGPSQWEPLAQYSEGAAASLGLEWYGPSVAEFVAAYQAAYGEEPSYHGAGGYAAGLILQRAIETAGSFDAQQVKAALDSLNLMTFFGHLKFDTTPANHGLQIGHEMVYVQWQTDAAHNLVKQVVWPADGKSAETLYPAFSARTD
jgi:branched-chain amino acid transport system substrate-binding protein